MRSAGFSYSMRSTLPELGLDGSCMVSSDCIEPNKSVHELPWLKYSYIAWHARL